MSSWYRLITVFHLDAWIVHPVDDEHDVTIVGADRKFLKHQHYLRSKSYVFVKRLPFNCSHISSYKNHIMVLKAISLLILRTNLVSQKDSVIEPFCL